jgi:hypothetical protein
MARRIILIVVWTIVFTLGSAFLLGFVSALIYGPRFSSDAQLDKNMALTIGTLFAWIPLIAGLAGLLLGIFGKLPGTRRPPGSPDK